MTDYAEAVVALYDTLHTWEHVAVACGFTPKQKSYFRKISLGEIKRPGIRARRGIAKATARHVTGLLLPTARVARGGLTIRHSLWLRLRAVKLREGWTWDKLMEKALEVFE